MARPTILQIIPELETGGAELAVLEISSALKNADARAITLSQGGRMVEELAALGAEHVMFPAATKNPVRMYGNSRVIARFIKEQKVSLIHARSRAPAWSALLAARKTGVPFVTTYHGAYSNKEPFKNFYNSVMARGDVVIANSRYTADLVRGRHAPEEDRLKIVYRGVDLQQFDIAGIAPERLQALRNKWRIREGQRVILQAARLTGWKGQRTVIEAAKLIKERGEKNFLFALAGDAQGRGSYVRELEDRIKILGLEDEVRLVGHCDDMAAAFALAHVAVVASTDAEAFGRAAAEAQAVGCPVIATRIGAPPETVRALPDFSPDERTGWLVPPGDQQSLADALLEVFAMGPAERSQMSARAMKNVADNFSGDAMKFKTLQIYDGLLGTSLAAAYQNSKKAQI